MEIDVLAGEQGPSCQSMEHIKDLRLIYVRFIKRETLRSLPLDNREFEQDNEVGRRRRG
jgi:hypothetical protein